MEEYSKITERTDRTTFVTNAANYFIENDYRFLHVENEEVTLFKQMTEEEICQKIRERFQSTHSLMKSNPNCCAQQLDSNYIHVGKPLLFAPISDNDNNYAVIRKKDILFGTYDGLVNGVQRHPGTQEYYRYTYDHMEEYSRITESIDRKTFFLDVANYFIQKDYRFLHVENEEVTLFKEND
jgi:hypothetical protein